MTMTNIEYITVHCSAGALTQTVDNIRKYHLSLGWSDIGYHFFIDAGGAVKKGRPITKMGSHVKGHNQNNIGICLAGGVMDGKAVDNFTTEQKESLRRLIFVLAWKYEIKASNVKGHRDWSPDLNGDGTIQASERIKECPCFDVKTWFNLSDNTDD